MTMRNEEEGVEEEEEAEIEEGVESVQPFVKPPKLWFLGG
jgi:hypothetical protein